MILVSCIFEKNNPKGFVEKTIQKCILQKITPLGICPCSTSVSASRNGWYPMPDSIKGATLVRIFVEAFEQMENWKRKPARARRFFEFFMFFFRYPTGKKQKHKKNASIKAKTKQDPRREARGHLSRAQKTRTLGSLQQAPRDRRSALFFLEAPLPIRRGL